MKRFYSKASQNKRGFTLIEMIVVIAIIAILIALVAPVMNRYMQTAKEIQYGSVAKSLYTAGNAYCADVLIQRGFPDGDAGENGHGLNSINEFGNGTFMISREETSVLEEYIGGDVWNGLDDSFTYYMVIIYGFSVKYAALVTNEYDPNIATGSGKPDDPWPCKTYVYPKGAVVTYKDIRG